MAALGPPRLTRRRAGRSVVSPEPHGDQVVAVDLGGTKIAVAAVDRAGTCGPVLVRPTPATQGPDAVLGAVAEAVEEVRGSTASSGACEVRAVGVGAAGVIDEASRTVLSATDAIAGWVGTSIGTRLEQAVGVPVAVDNDVNAHATGEVWLGAGRGASRVVMVTVGTGVGGAVVLDGRPLHGAHHVAGEVGHVPARGAEDLTCGCGRRGHLEAIASGTGLLRHYRGLGGDPTVPDTRGVVAEALAGEATAKRAVTDAATALGTALAGMVMLVDPDVVILGGGVVDAGALWWQPMETALRSELIDVARDVPVRPAELGARAALVGAARRAWDTVAADTAATDTVPADAVPADAVPADKVAGDTVAGDAVSADAAAEALR